MDLVVSFLVFVYIREREEKRCEQRAGSAG